MTTEEIQANRILSNALTNKSAGRSYYEQNALQGDPLNDASVRDQMKSMVESFGRGLTLSQWRDTPDTEDYIGNVQCAVVWDQAGKEIAESIGYRF